MKITIEFDGKEPETFNDVMGYYMALQYPVPTKNKAGSVRMKEVTRSHCHYHDLREIIKDEIDQCKVDGSYTHGLRKLSESLHELAKEIALVAFK